jgi:phosphoribosyl 1,2-cyclic phosphodiesterase
MALHITSLNSGSNGNCYYIGNDTEAVLVDTGLSCRETEKRMLSLGLNMKKVKAIFISHEHGDHIKGLQVIASKYDLPVYISPDTYAKSGLQLASSALQWLDTQKEVKLGNLGITSFTKKHDAADPHSFIISCNGVTVGVFTDIGEACSNVTSHFNRCHAAFLEANYDDEMLENGHYPFYLKNRIRGTHGHLSNKQALDIFTTHRPSFMSHLLLSHLSKDNNDPILVQRLFENHSLNTKIIVASRYESTPIFRIEKTSQVIAKTKKIKTKINVSQMGMFD